ncbi:glycosyltransferase [Herbaspirillum sp.]|uniref:glycosyltransferase n=1 Tax=Herbaspirillum sp. TaxID=1890675 RepID=UPI001B25DE2B|nr:glycosyltransferase [Herbaspirillum sp.]MBO9536956.1 glycosyltransferase [Herbaspirillum sp.]
MRILLISYYFPPYNTVGAIRPGKFAKYLHLNGHAVEVISAANPAYVKGLQLEIPPEFVHEVKSWSINAPIYWLLGGKGKVAQEGFHGGKAGSGWRKRLGLWYKTLLHWPDAESNWVRSAIDKGLELFKQRGFDLIYVSAPSFSALRVGHRLSARTGTPWVAEFRDLWSANHNYPHPAWRRAIDRAWEASLLRTASALVTVSLPLAQELQRFSKPVWEIRNGYDPDDLSGISVRNTPSDILNIVYTGSVYPEHHDLNTFCAGVTEFVRKGGKIHVDVAGRNVAALRTMAHQFGIESHFTFRPTVDRHEALTMQRSADVLLMFAWNDGSAGVYTTKLFEYAAARRPILAVGPDCDVVQWVSQAQIGSSTATPEGVVSLLAGWTEQKRISGTLNTSPSPEHDFTRNAQFSKLIPLLTSLIQDGHGKPAIQQ